MVVSRVMSNPLWATLVGALVAAIGVSFFVFVRSGEALPRAAADGQPPSASVSPEIVGGTPVPDDKYPFMSFIELLRNGKPFAACGGTLIDSDSVLTAAHCLVDATGARVTVGATDRTQADQGQTIRAIRGFIHPRFNHPGLAYDVGVLKLERPVKGIKPIKLATASQNNLETPGHLLTVAGWGVTKPKGNQETPRMREVSIPMVSDSRAKRAYATAPPYVRAPPYYPSLQVAAGEKGKDACFGDSGGPLFDPGSRTEVGITSHGVPCATGRYPTVFTEVNNPKIKDFIVSAAKR